MTAEGQAASGPSPSGRPAPPKITIVLAEDLHLVLGGIRCLLGREEDFQVVGEATDGLRVVGLVERLKPRILVVAVAMPGLNGLEIARQVRQQSPATAVIMLSRYSNEQYVIQALRNGASGYVVKSARPPELVRAIRKVVAGDRYLSEPLSEHTVETWLRRAKRGALDGYEMLSVREREVLQLVSEGHSSAGIASRLSISPRTAESHRASVMRKMRFGSLVDVVLFAIARGILVLPSDPLRSDRTSTGSRE
ncbi:MAG TPA: response regulator transcription factor [Methylomirabilota bacterium]|nr:response regulator transcription factor [Methylomirabilota bacterium]